MYTKIQDYLKNNGINDKTLKDLSENHGIESSFDEEIDTHLINFNYNQINAKKDDPLVMECRGIVINKEDLSIQSKAFNRFFNYGEVESSFDFNNCFIEEKIDGSLIRISFDKKDNTWKFGSRGTVNARGVYTNDEYGNIPYCKLICDALDIYNEDIPYNSTMSKDSEEKTKALDVDIYLEYRKRFHEFMEKIIPECFNKETMTIICELVSPHIQSTTLYKNTELYVLSVIDNSNIEHPLMHSILSQITINNNIVFKKPKLYEINSLNSIHNLISNLNKDKQIIKEGFVAVNPKTKERIKFKSDLYLKMHYYISNGVTPKRLFNIYMDGEKDEFLTYYPKYKYIFDNFEENKNNQIYEIKNLYLILKSLIDSNVSMKDIAQKYCNNKHFKSVITVLKKNLEFNEIKIFDQYSLSKKLELLVN